MSPPGRRHVAFVDNLNQLLVIRLAGRGIVSVQNPVVLAEDTEPQPDLAIRRLRAVPYKEREAFAEDVLLLIEVADTSLRYDRSTKLRLYAEAGVLEYWLVDCNAESIEVFRAPDPVGIVTSAGSVGIHQSTSRRLRMCCCGPARSSRSRRPTLAPHFETTKISTTPRHRLSPAVRCT